MSRKLAPVLFALFVLTSAMGLKAVFAAYYHGPVLMANGSAPPPRRP